jgi:hypothetical protein
MGEDEILHSVHDFIHTRIADTQWHEGAGRLPAGSIVYAEATCLRAFAEGFRVGSAAVGQKRPPIVSSESQYLRFPTVRAEARRNIVFVSSSYTGNLTGGVGRLFSDLAPAIAARGHDVRVVTRAVGPAAVDFEEAVWVHRIDVPKLSDGEGVAPDVLAPINDFATSAAAEVQRIRGWTEPDLVFAPLWDVEGIGVLRTTDLPVAVHVSTPVAVIGPMAGYLRGDDGDPPELRRLLALEAEVLDTADRFQANTDAVMGTVRDHYERRCDDARWEVLNIGLKDHAVAGSAVEPATKRRTVFFAGRFEARKGIDTLLAAMARVLADRDDVELVLAGEDRPLAPGLAPVGAAWRSEHAAAPWIRRVRMLGVVDDEALHRRYAEADLVVLPSRYESFGLVMVEAMMHGKPLISTDGSGIREVVRHGIDGLLVPPGDDEVLEAAIRRLLDDRELAQSLGDAARRRYDDNFAIDRVAQRFERFFLGLHSVDSDKDDDRPVVTAGGRLTLELPERIATIVLCARTPATVRLVGGTGEIVTLASAARRRVRVEAPDGAVTVAVADGEVVVERIVAVGRQPALT